MKKYESLLKEVVIQSALGDPKAKEIIADIKKTYCQYIVDKASVQYIKEPENIDLFVLIEKEIGRSLVEEEKDRIKEYIYGSSKEKSHSAGNTMTLK